MKKNWAYRNNITTLEDFRKYKYEQTFKLLSDVMKTIGMSFRQVASDIEKAMTKEEETNGK